MDCYIKDNLIVKSLDWNIDYVKNNQKNEENVENEENAENEKYTFKNEEYTFKNEEYTFKNEEYTFKNEIKNTENFIQYKNEKISNIVAFQKLILLSAYVSAKIKINKTKNLINVFVLIFLIYMNSLIIIQ